jgi:hypothetical protein
MTSPQSPQPELTEAEIRAQLEAAQARLVEQMGQAQQDLAEARRILETDREKLTAELAELDARVQKLSPYKDHPEGALHYATALAFSRAKTAEKRMVDHQLVVLEQNLALATNGIPEGWDGEGSPFRDAATEPAYNVARVTMDYYLAGFYWLRRLELVDSLLRAVGHPPAIQARNAAEEETRTARAEELKAAIRADKETLLTVMRIAEDLSLAQATLPWAKTSLARLEILAPADQRVLLADADWNKLNGALRVLETLPDTLAALPALAAFDFSTPDVELEDPFDDIVLPNR